MLALKVAMLLATKKVLQKRGHGTREVNLTLAVKLG